jgi:hypothetical protein
MHTAILAKTVRDFKWSPPKGAYVETPLALNRGGQVRIIEPEKAAPGNYQVNDDEWLAGTVDVAWLDGTILWVPDFKFGQDKYVAPIAKNGQLMTGALMMHRLLEQQGVTVTHLMPAVIYVRIGEPQGVWETLPAPLPVDGVELQVWRNRLKKTLVTLDGLKLEQDAGKPLSGYCTAEHCALCPCIHACPPFADAVRRFVSSPNLQLGSKAEPLEGEQIVEAAKFFGLLKRAVATMDTLLRNHCTQVGSIELDKGLTFGLQEQDRTEYVANVQSIAALVKMLGEGPTYDAISISKTAVKDAVREYAKATGMKQKAVIEGLETQLQSLGALQAKRVATMTTYRSDEPEIVKA